LIIAECGGWCHRAVPCLPACQHCTHRVAVATCLPPPDSQLGPPCRSVSGNSLTGSIPSTWSAMTSLQSM
jgi:hypothetical protein